MQKRVFVVHGWDFNQKMNWYQSLKKTLEKKGFKVIIPDMPNSSEPNIHAWISHLKKLVGKLNRETYFVGHSIGCQTIMRYLQDKKTKINKIVFVAGWFNLKNLEGEEVEKIARPWLKTPIKFNNIKKNMGKLTVILSDNDPYNCLKENYKIFKEKLNAKIIIEKGKGHFTSEDGVKELPIVIRELIK